MGKIILALTSITLMLSLSGCLLLYNPSGSRTAGKSPHGPITETKYQDSYGNEVTVRDDGVVSQMKSKDPLGNDFTAIEDTSGTLTGIGLVPYPNTEPVEYVTKTETWENDHFVSIKVHQFTRDNPVTVLNHYTSQLDSIQSTRSESHYQHANGTFRNMVINIHIVPYNGDQTSAGGYTVSVFATAYK